ncbi:conserved hypothetical protein [Ricinus communis]|uniref:Transmembrane protein n=2 Tax=Ricinus communis TaxID=3988 RepID=B9SWT8_RICCO|nr:conserved hypothetical protein [Ricinus communis]
MLCIKSLPFLLLPTFLLISSTFLSSSHGASEIHLQPNLHLRGIIEDGEFDVLSWETRRSILDRNSSEFSDNKSMILAAKITHRRDPLDNFKYYKGGWNISEEHYFYSVAYTAAPLFLIAVIWFIGYAVALLTICIRHCCCQLKHHGYSQTTYVLCLAFLIFFTVAEIIGCIVLYTGQEKFHSSSTSTLKFVVHQADNTVDNLTVVSENLSAAQGAGVDQFSLPSSVQNSISKVNNMINSSASTLRDATDDNSNKIQKALDSVRVILIILAAVMLLLAFLGFLLSIFGLQTWVYPLAVIGWILATTALILCCLFLILHNVVGDTCVAMDEWVQNPTAHTALDDILPCVDKATAQQILSESKQVTFQLVTVVNSFITTVSNINPPKNLPPNLPPEAKLLYYNQSGPPVPVLCNPFNSDMIDRKCAAGEVDSSNASQVWSKYICQVSENGNCTTTGRLTPKFYNQMTYAVNVSYALYHYGPFLVGLVDCTFVRETFSSISEHHCPGLNRYSGWVFIGFVMVSVAVMVSLIFWVFYARERRQRLGTKQFINLSTQESIK